ncbi:MAG TPA: FAD-dependent oxidoreductase [Solirubrobacteraceae bacterium]|nr:FAD-dependent oxidoreductase [Solirubrobacteraceae bacterium]
MEGKLEVIVAGGGVAGLEAAFALRELAGARVAVTVVSAEAEFVYRPLAVREPFTEVPPERYALREVIADAGAEHVHDSFRWLDPQRRTMHTRGGRELGYDALVLALGARARPYFRRATTLRYGHLREQLAELAGAVERRELRRLAVVIPSRVGWPLPVYELCLLVARHARERDLELEITLATREEAPLAWFGARAAEAVAEVLDEAGIRLVTGVRCEIPAAGVLSVRPGMTEIECDRVVAAPQLYGPSTPGVPKRARDGFISIDPHCQVRGLLGVYAAGDATDFPVKFGAVAGQQADAAAASIAALVGACDEPPPFQPVIHGVLAGGHRPLYLSAHLIGEHAYRSELETTPCWRLPTRLAAPHLASYLDSRQRAPAS